MYKDFSCDYQGYRLGYNINSNGNTVTVVRCEGEVRSKIVIPDSVVYDNNTYKVVRIGERVFHEWSERVLKSVEIPASVTEIGEDAISGCSGLTSVEIPESVTKIGDCAFSGCIGLTSVKIPKSVKKIGDFAFRGCGGLTSVEMPETEIEISETAFGGCPFKIG